MNSKNNSTQEEEGIRVDMMREPQLSSMENTEKIRYIIDRVRDGRIVILENGLKPDEEALLIEKTMTEIDHEDFKGLDIESYPDRSGSDTRNGIISRFFNRSGHSSSNLTVIGPASRMKTLHKDSNHISTLLSKR